MKAVTESDIIKFQNDIVTNFTVPLGVDNYHAILGTEKSIRAEYSGREILEMLQNAIDELTSSVDDNKILIRFRGDKFQIFNTGEPFIEGAIHSLASPHNSTKTKRKKSKLLIGNKGLGFRSYLNWAHTIRVYSKNGLQISYNSDESSRCLREKMQSVPKMKDFEEYPTLCWPVWLEKGIDLHEYTTCIELQVLPDVRDDIRRQINNITDATLMFLPDVNELIIEDGVNRRVYKKQTVSKTKNAERVLLTDADGEKTVDIYRKTGTYVSEKGEPEDYEIKIALDETIDPKKNYLFSYFRTNIRVPIKWRIHATLDLDASRNEITHNKKNSSIITAMQDFIFEVAESIARERIDYSVADSLCHSITFDNRLIFNDDGPSFDELFEERYRSTRFLPTMSGSLISIDENPWYLSGELANYIIKGKVKQEKALLGRLLQGAIPESILGKYENNLFHPPLDIISDYFDHLRRLEPLKSDVVQLTDIAYFIFDEYYYPGIEPEKLPSLFVTDNLSVIGKDIHIGSAEGVSKAPSFVRFKFMNIDQYNYLLELIQTRRHQGLEDTDFGIFYGIKTIDLDQILEEANARLKNQKDPKKLQGYMLEYLDFVSSNGIMDDENVLLLSRNDILRPASELYFGAEYGNELCENLFLGKDDYFLKSADYFNKSSEELEAILANLVATKPRQYEKVADSFRQIEYYCHAYDHLDLILQSEPKYFFQWFFDVFPFVRESETKQIVLGKNNDRPIDANYSELYRIIKKEKVFKTPKAQYDFAHVFHGDNGKLIAEHVDGILGVDLEEYFRDMGVEVDRDRIDNIVRLFHIPSAFEELDVESFYAILSALPSFDKNGTIASRIYNSDIVRGDKFEQKVDKYLKNNSLDYPKVYTNHGFVSAKNAMYANYKEPSSLERIISFVKIPKRLKTERIKIIFGVNGFKNDMVQILGKPRRDDNLYEALKADIEDLKAYALAIRLSIAKDKKNKDLTITRIRELDIIPTQEVTITYDGAALSPLRDEIGFVRDGKTNTFYIVTNNEDNLTELRLVPAFRDAIFSIFATLLDAEAGLDIIEKMFGSNPEYRETMYIDDNQSVELLNKARQTLGVEREIELPKSEDSVMTHNLELLTQIMNNSFGQYVTALYDDAIRDADLRTSFLYNCQKYEDFNFERDFSTDDRAELAVTELSETEARELLQRYFADLDYNTPDRKKAIESNGAKNRKIISQHFDEYEDVVQEYLSSASCNSRLYFDEERDDLIGEIRQRIEKATARAEQEGQTEIVLTYTPALEINTVKDIEDGSSPRTRTRRNISRKAPSVSAYRETEIKKQESGGRAEYEVRKSLEQNPDYTNIKWHSAYATNIKYATEEFLEDTSDDGIGYDLSYDFDGERRFAEVKKCTFNGDKATFTMSANELECAKRNREQYDLFLVEFAGSQPKRIERIQSFCEKDFTPHPESYQVSIFCRS